ncbi:hypothetical protein [Faecalicatena contorta]|uniref:hypothetical protein n=1 Tax=Faecalicatena contorta TaxID=39482 RepID=UPI002ED4D928
MKKKIAIVLSAVALLAIIGALICSAYRSSEAYRKGKASMQWDCSVTCAEKSSDDEYVITYSEVRVTSKTGTLTIQNRNDFDIVAHLFCDGEQEIVSDAIPSGGSYSFLKITDKEYTVGVHADVDENSEIQVFVYDSKNTEPFIINR